MEPIVGIDLGTTNSEVAFIINENAEIITDSDSGILPSCVGIDDSGKIMVGATARNQAVIAPEKTVMSIKRMMGKDETVSLGDQKYRPQEISAFILKALKERAEKKLGQAVSRAVITVPAYFTDAQRHATREAGELAGLEVVRIINEPTAASLAYERFDSETRRILVYDLGGGTFDVSIVRIEQGVVEVLASTGDNHLGGDDFDLKIRDRLADYCENELKVNVTKNPQAMARLRLAAENAKIALSTAPYVMVEEDHIGKKLGRDIHLSFELSRPDFEEMISDDVDRTLEMVSKALKDAQMLPAAIDKIILVGGSTRMPAISNMLEEKFGKPPHGEIDPDLCVALGAAIQAGREMGMDSSGVLLDITPYTFGTSAMGEIDGIPTMDQFVPLIKRNTKLPASRTEAFGTVVDHQEAVDIQVYQGENPNALDNILIGKYVFHLTKAPQGSVILLNYQLDLNGILKIEAVEKKTGRKINAVIENAFTGFSDEDLVESKKRIAMMWDESDSGESGNASDAGDSAGKVTVIGMPEDIAAIIRDAEGKLGDAPEDDRDEIINLIEDIRDAVEAGKMDAARDFSQSLEEILFYIG